jgi:dolichol-phosphate mannosyltransferase
MLHSIAARDDRVFVYSLSRNFGKEIAMTAGLDTAEGEAVILLDSDLQHPPELIPRMLDLWQQGNEIVTAVRTANNDSSPFKRLCSRLFYALMNRLCDTPIVPNATDFCLFSRRVCRALRAMPERHRFIRGLVSWIGFRRAFVEFEAPARAGGTSKYTLRQLWALASSAFFSFSTVPIKVAIRLGALMMCASLGYLAYILGMYLIVGVVTPGWASLICTLLILGGMQLVFMGLIGEYLARVYEEAKRRPLYFFQEVPAHDSSQSEEEELDSARVLA